MRFKQFILLRFLLTIPMLFIITSITFFLLRILPGNPALAILGEEATPESVKALEELLGLNKPWHEQFISFWLNVLRGDLGKSLRTGGNVNVEILSRLPTTLELVIGGIALGNIVAIIIGCESGYRRGLLDYFARAYSVFGYCVPIFWLGLMFQLLFGVYLGILPIQGSIDPSIAPKRITGSVILDCILSGNLYALIDALRHYALPWLVLSLWYSAVNSRVLRANISEVLLQDYIVTARAKGLDRTTILYKHALKNALIPFLTLMGLQFARALSGVVLTETVFNIPGMGRLLFVSILNRDYPVVQGIIIWITIVVAITLLIIDILLAHIDPRIKY